MQIPAAAEEPARRRRDRDAPSARAAALPAARPRAVGRPRVLRGGDSLGPGLGVVLLCVLLGLVLLYVARAARSDALQDASQRRGRAPGGRQKRELHRRLTALRGDKALEREARRLGMVRRGERAYVIRPARPTDGAPLSAARLP